QTSLKRNGFQFGVAGAHPPEALQALVGLRSDVAVNGRAEDKQLTGKRIYVRSGTSTCIQVSHPYPECDLTLHPIDTHLPDETRHYDGAQCTFVMTPHRVQEGWIRLEFVPEIQHGGERLRPHPGEQEWQLVNASQVDRLHMQRFSLILNIGELAVIS